MPERNTPAAAIAGVGATDYFRRGASVPRTELELAAEATLAALDDAGLTVDDVDGFTSYSDGHDIALLAQWLGVPEVRFTANLSGGGGGAAGAVGLAAAAITGGMAKCVVTVKAIQQAGLRYGAAFAPGAAGGYAADPEPEGDFIRNTGLMAPGQMFALVVQRHMARYGTTREHFAEVAISTRANASARPKASKRELLTKQDYFAGRMISDPFCIFDYCLENDGGAAVVTVESGRAPDLRHAPVYIGGSCHGGAGRWGQAITWLGMPDDQFASAGHRSVAADLWRTTGLSASDVDVALLYDNFGPLVILQLEDYGFCPIGDGGEFVAAGGIRWPGGTAPVNTHGGNLSEAYILGMTHILEGVEQIRGTAVNQVQGAEVALVTGGPAPIPTSNLLLHA